MTPSLGSYVVVGAVAALVTVLTVPIFRLVAPRLGGMTDPDERRVHAEPTSSLGGGALYLGFLAAVVVAWASGWFESTFSSSSEPIGLVAGATIAYLVGVRDDVREISAPAKTAGLVVAASALVFGGVSIIYFRVPFLDLFVPGADIAFLLTVLWVLGMTTALNFIDGLDGLAAGIVGIGSLSFFAYAWQLTSEGLIRGGNLGPLVAIIVTGVCVGFLPWNVHPARIFMGDGGALLLGTLVAASTMAVGGRTDVPYSGQTFFFYAPLVIPLLILGVPVFDTVFAIVRRAVSGKGVATADMGHLHHRLIKLGHGHRRSVAILWAWTALLSGFVLWPTYQDGRFDAIVPIGVAALGLLLFTLFHPSLSRDRGDPATSAAAAPRAGESTS